MVSMNSNMLHGVEVNHGLGRRGRNGAVASTRIIQGQAGEGVVEAAAEWPLFSASQTRFLSVRSASVGPAKPLP